MGGGGLYSFQSWVGSGQTGEVSFGRLNPWPCCGHLRCGKGTKFPGTALGLRLKVSERLVGSAGLGLPAGRLADDAVRVLAAAPWAAQAVVATLGQLHAAGGRQVAEQAGQHQGEGAHEGPAGAAV